MIACGNDDLYARLCHALDAPDLVDDERYRTPSARVGNRHALHADLEAKTAGSTAASLIERIRAAGVPVGPVNDLGEAVEEPVTAERSLLVDVQDAARFPGLKLVRLPFDDARPPALRRPPELGEHSREVLAEAGFAPEEIARALAAPAS